MTIYICLSFLSIAISFFAFHPHLVILPISVLPLLLLFISVVEMFLLKGEQNQSIDDYRLNNTAYSFREIDFAKVNCSKKWLLLLKKISLPLFLLFALYFNVAIKCIFSILIYVLTYILSSVFVMMENRIKSNNSKT